MAHRAHTGAEGTSGGPRRASLFTGDPVYAVVDAARLSEGATLLVDHPGLVGSLFEGDAAEDWADVAPYLIRLTEDDPLTALLFTQVDGIDAAVGSLHLWPANPACFFITAAPAEQLRRHLRRFVRPADGKGVRRYVRMSDPRIMTDYLRDIDAPTDVLRSLLTGVNAPLTIVARQGSEAVIARALDGTPPGKPILADADIRALTLRHKRDFHARLTAKVAARADARGIEMDRKRIDAISTKVMTAMEDHTPGDAPTMADHVKLVTVLTLMHDDATDPVLTGPVMRNPHLPWNRRVDITAKSYVTALKRLAGQDVV